MVIVFCITVPRPLFIGSRFENPEESLKLREQKSLEIMRALSISSGDSSMREYYALSICPFHSIPGLAPAGILVHSRYSGACMPLRVRAVSLFLFQLLLCMFV